MNFATCTKAFIFQNVLLIVSLLILQLKNWRLKKSHRLFTSLQMSTLHVCRILTRPHIRNRWRLPNIAGNVQGSTTVTDPGISTVRLSAVEFLGVWELFWCSFTYIQCFVVRSENKMHIVNNAYCLQLKYMLVMQSDFTKTKPQKLIKGKWGRPVRSSWIHL